ncbi:MAG TPA: AgmX/PglI C-terminal domain-containing protein [Gammaproteobacteria bacterium]|nr:AgmX/PglI C-terminal domain-containing protein [Gammaproteobacteria bacterium]
MAEAVALYRAYELPWSANAEQEQRFKRIVGACVGALLILALIFSFSPVPQRDPSDVQEIPKRLARLVVERQVPPPPPPVVQELPPEPEPLPEQEPEQVVEQRVVEPDPVPVVEPEPDLPPVDTAEQARARARVAGLLPFAEQLSSLRDSEAAGRLDQTDIVGVGPGTAATAERSLITSRVGTSSGGINTAALSRSTGGGGLGGRATTQVESSIAALSAAEAVAQRSGESNKASRSREEIERVFDLNKGAIYALYNRALRQNPALEGKLVLRLTIAPNGSVTFCEVVSSELRDADLEQKLVQRVLLFQFEAKDVEVITTTKPIDFFPA